MIVSQINTLNNNVVAQGSQLAQGCCVNIVNALTGLATSVVTAIGAIPKPEAPIISIDLSGITAALAALQVAVVDANAQESNCCAKIDADLQAIANAIPKSIDLSPVSDAINKQTEFWDVPDAILKQLAQDMRLPPQYQALFQGKPWPHVKSIIDGLAWMTTPDALHAAFHALESALPSGSRIILDKVKDVINGFLRQLPGYAKEFWKEIQPILVENIQLSVSAEAAIFTPVIEPMVQAVVSLLTPTPGASISLGTIGVSPDKPIAAATGVALSAAFAGWFLSYVGIDAGEPLTKIAELFGAAVGYEEIRDVLVGPYIRHGIAAVADMKARSLFKQHLPKGEDVCDWMARGLVTQAFGRTLLTFDGFGDQISPPAINAAFQGIRAFQLIRLLQTGMFTSADIQDELTFGAMRPASQARIVGAAPYIATETERKALQSTLINAYVAGLLSDSDLTAQVNSIEQNFDRDSLILTDAKWKRLIKTTADLEIEYSTLYKGGVITDSQYRSFIAAIGVQDPVASALTAKAEASANAALLKRELQDAVRLARKTQDEEIKAALKNYSTGKIPLAALTAALVATGLTPIQAVAWTDLAQLKQVGDLRWVFGLQVNAADAALLRERVAALVAQREKELISDAQLATSLKNLKIPDDQANAIRAHAAALVALSTTAKPALVAVQTAG